MNNSAKRRFWCIQVELLTSCINRRFPRTTLRTLHTYIQVCDEIILIKKEVADITTNNYIHNRYNDIHKCNLLLTSSLKMFDFADLRRVSLKTDSASLLL